MKVVAVLLDVSLRLPWIGMAEVDTVTCANKNHKLFLLL
jgi:hypothetical protein